MIKKSNFYMKLSTYQRSIIDDLTKGAILQCTEGANYKAWLLMPDQTKKTVKVNTAEIITSKTDCAQWLSFCKNGDIKIKQ